MLGASQILFMRCRCQQSLLLFFLNATRLGRSPSLACRFYYSTVRSGALVSACRSVLAQPRSQLRLLLRLQIDAVVDALDRLPIGSFRRVHLMGSETVRHLIAHVGIAKAAGRIDDLRARKGP